MYIDAHVHADIRSYEDFESMALAGIEAAVACAHDIYRMSTADVYLDHFHRLVETEVKRAQWADLELYVAVGLHPGAIPDDHERVLDILPEFLTHDRVVAIGETGLERNTPEEREVLRRQMEIAADGDVPIVAHLPNSGTVDAAEVVLELREEAGLAPELLLIDHVDEEVLETVEESGAWLGLSVQPPSKLSAEEAAGIVAEHDAERFVLSSDISSIPSDPLALPRTAREMRRQEVDEDDIDRVTRGNAAKLYSLE